MKVLILSSIFFIAVVAGAYIYQTRPCFGAFCPSYKCYSTSSCGGRGCICLKEGMDFSGKCYSTDRADILLKQGWKILP